MADGDEAFLADALEVADDTEEVVGHAEAS